MRGKTFRIIGSPNSWVVLDVILVDGNTKYLVNKGGVHLDVKIIDPSEITEIILFT